MHGIVVPKVVLVSSNFNTFFSHVSVILLELYHAIRQQASACVEKELEEFFVMFVMLDTSILQLMDAFPVNVA